MMTVEQILALVSLIVTTILAVWALSERIARKAEQKRNNDQKPILEKMNKIEESLSILSNYIKERDGKQDAINKEVVALHMEQVKQHIRELHKKVYETGDIGHEELAFADKLFSHYQQLHGNSDIAQKVNDLHRLFDKRFQEKMDERKNSGKKKKPVIKLMDAVEGE